MKKYGKKWNAKVYDDKFRELKHILVGKMEDLPVTILEITPEMKKSVQGTPQPLFSYFGGTVLGAELVSDTIQNNIISDDKLIVINKYLQIFVFTKIIGITKHGS